MRRRIRLGAAWRWLAGMMLAAGLLQGCAGLAPPVQDLAPNRVVHAGSARDFHYFAPPGAGRTVRRPMLIVLHGAYGSRHSIARATKFHKLAERDGFIVVYPGSSGPFWNAVPGMPLSGDDVAVIRALIDKVDRELAPVDRRAIFVAGFSNGGGMAMRLACELPGVFAGIASVGSTMPISMASGCTAARPVSMMLMHGTADPIAPYSGGVLTSVGVPPIPMMSAGASVGVFSRVNRCAPDGRSGGARSLDLAPSARVRVTSFAGCGRNRVELWTLPGGSHDWPRILTPDHHAYPGNQVDASVEIWRFFRSILGRPRRVAARSAGPARGN